MKKILITMSLLVLSTMPCFADADLVNTMFNAVRAVNYGVSPTAVLRDSAYDYAQQKINNAQQNVQPQNNYYQPTQYQTNTQYQAPQYQTNTQYPTQQVNPYQNVNADTNTQQYSTPAQNLYVENVQSYNGSYIIKPFGTFNFDDGVIDVINKLKATPGISEIYFNYDNFYVSPCKTINLKNVPNEKLSSVLNAYLVRQTTDMKTCKRQKGVTFLDSNGKNRYCYGFPATITAKTVLIENTPFEITITFHSGEGAVIRNPNKVIKDSAGYFYPLFIWDIGLKSSSSLINNNWGKINQLCKNKFSTLINALPEVERTQIQTTRENYAEWEVNDAKGNSFSFHYDNSCELDYSMDYYSKYLENLYKEHLKKIESQKYKSVPNSQI